MIILHIGLHKTGTSSLQSFFAGNRPALAKGGITYPTIARGGAAGHHRLPMEILQGRRGEVADEAWQEVLAQIRPPATQHAILSAEGFSGLALPEVEVVRERLGSLPVKVVVYLRDQASWLASVYTQVVKTAGETADFDSFFQARLQKGIRFSKTLDDWSAVFGRDNLVVRVMESGQLHGGDVLQDFIHCCGLDMDGIAALAATWPRENQSPGSRELLLARTLTQQLKGRVGHDPLNRKYLRAIRVSTDRLGWAEPRAQLLRSEHLQQAQAEFGEDNARVARDYLGRADGKLFRAPAKASQAAGPDIAQLGATDLVEILADLIEAVEKGLLSAEVEAFKPWINGAGPAAARNDAARTQAPAEPGRTKARAGNRKRARPRSAAATATAAATGTAAAIATPAASATDAASIAEPAAGERRPANRTTRAERARRRQRAGRRQGARDLARD